MIAVLLAGALTLTGQMPPLELYTYLPIIRTHVQLGEGPDTVDAGPCCDNTIVIPTGEVAIEQPDNTVETLYVHMVYRLQFGNELPVGSGHTVYLYDVDSDTITRATTTNAQSMAVFTDVPYGEYDIHGIFEDQNPFYDFDCRQEGVTLDQPIWTEKLVCEPYWTLRLPWSKGT